MYTEIEAARLLVMKAAYDKDQGNNYDTSSAAAKLYASKVAMTQTVEAVQIHGGNGFALEYQISRVLCDARILNIFEGAAEIQAQVIARRLME